MSNKASRKISATALWLLVKGERFREAGGIDVSHET
jgi:hypothetical protein